MTDIPFNTLLNRTLTEIHVSDENEKDEIIFVTNDNQKFKLYYEQDCCAFCSIEDITGDLTDLIGTPLLEAEEECSDKNPDGIDKGYQESFTWTFYKLATIKGCVTIRWYGESNGYYSEQVTFKKIE